MIHIVNKEEHSNIHSISVATAKLQRQKEAALLKNQKAEANRLKQDIIQLQQLRNDYAARLAEKYAVLPKQTIVDVFALAKTRKGGRRRKTNRLVGKGRVWEFRYFEKKGYVSYEVERIEGRTFDPEKHYLLESRD